MNIKINIISSFIIRGLSMIVSLYTFPVYMNYFDNQQVLGIWFTIISILMWILSFDLGIGNGLRNKLTYSFEKKEIEDIKKYIVSSYIMTFLISLIIVILGYFLLSIIDWNKFFNIKKEIIDNYALLIVVRTIFIGIMVQFILKLINSILFALHQSFLPGLLNFFSSLSLLIYVIVATPQNLEYNLKSLSLVYILTSNIPLLITTILIFLTKLKYINFNFKNFSISHFKDVIKLGGTFFFIQIVYMIMANSNEILITKLTGPENVVEYQIYYKIFSLVFVIYGLGLTPIWSAVTKAYSNNDIKWILNIYIKLKKSIILTLGLYFIIIVFLEKIIKFWIKNRAIETNYNYAIIFVIFGLVFIWANVLSTIANGMGELKIQLISMTLGALVNIILSIILVSIYKNWIVIVIANTISFLPYCIFQSNEFRKLR